MKDAYVVITQIIDDICDADGRINKETFIQSFKYIVGRFPTIAEIEYFEYYAHMWDLLEEE